MRHKAPRFKVVKVINGVEFGLVKIAGFQWVSNSGNPTGFELKDAERWAVQLGEGYEVRPCAVTRQ
jgi:hypothetical protein